MWEDFLMFISMALVLTWTIQLARAKHRNPWAWGGAAAAIMITILVYFRDGGPSLLISMLPMVVLFLLKSPQTTTSPSPQGVICARCSASQPHGRYYCTSCGWELKRPYPDDGQMAEETPVSASPPETAAPSPVGANAPTPDQVQPAAREPAPAQESPPRESTETPVGAATSDEPSPPTEDTPSVSRSALRPMTRGVPTAVAMTERGKGMVEEGRIQEAIDQFTKALALDGSYGPALESRAQAYASQGRTAEAEEDRRRLEAVSNG